MSDHGYAFGPILDDESPGFVSRFAVPTGDLWLYGSQPVQVSQRIAWTGGEPFMVVAADRLLYVGPPRDLDLVLRPRRRGQRPTGTPRSVWWRMSRSERRRLVSDPAFASLPVVKPAPVGVWNNGLAVAEVGP